LGLAESLADPLNVNCYQFYQLLRGSIMGKSVALLALSSVFVFCAQAKATIVANPTPFTSVVLSSPKNSFEVDNIRVAYASITAPVPEASTWVMMILGFLGVGIQVGYRRRDAAFRIARPSLYPLQRN
jgi:hypothetical protein